MTLSLSQNSQLGTKLSAWLGTTAGLPTGPWPRSLNVVDFRAACKAEVLFTVCLSYEDDRA